MADVAFSGDGATVAWVDESAQPARLLTETGGPERAGAGAPCPIATATPERRRARLERRRGRLPQHRFDAASPSWWLRSCRAARHWRSNHRSERVPAHACLPRAIRSPSSRTTQPAPASNRPRSPAPTTHGSGPTIPAGANDDPAAFRPGAGRPERPARPRRAGRAERRRRANAAANTPQDLSRAYVISTYLQAQGVVAASIELIVDPNARHTDGEGRERDACSSRGTRRSIPGHARRHHVAASATNPPVRTWCR